MLFGGISHVQLEQRRVTNNNHVLLLDVCEKKHLLGQFGFAPTAAFIPLGRRLAYDLARINDEN
jgi:hypothetical protein